MGPISRVGGWLDSASACPAVIFVLQQGTPPDVIYTFKHALVSLLRARRQQLHGKIAKAIEERWPHTEDTEPELLAHHYTEAKQPERAIPLWRKAGSLA
jgi:predicted ATPase